jgi:hypothetical protein
VEDLLALHASNSAAVAGIPDRSKKGVKTVSKATLKRNLARYEQSLLQAEQEMAKALSRSIAAGSEADASEFPFVEHSCSEASQLQGAEELPKEVTKSPRESNRNKLVPLQASTNIASRDADDVTAAMNSKKPKGRLARFKDVRSDGGVVTEEGKNKGSKIKLAAVESMRSAIDRQGTPASAEAPRRGRKRKVAEATEVVKAAMDDRKLIARRKSDSAIVAAASVTPLSVGGGRQGTPASAEAPRRGRKKKVLAPHCQKTSKKILVGAHAKRDNAAGGEVNDGTTQSSHKGSKATDIERPLPLKRELKNLENIFICSDSRTYEKLNSRTRQNSHFELHSNPRRK